MNEDHDRIEELLAGYVLLGLSGEDAVEADRLLSEHVPSCPRCRDQVAGFQAVAGDLALAVSPVPPPDLLLPRIRRGVAETPVRRRNRASVVAVAAGVAAIVGLAGLSVQLGGRVAAHVRHRHGRADALTGSRLPALARNEGHVRPRGGRRVRPGGRIGAVGAYCRYGSIRRDPDHRGTDG